MSAPSLTVENLDHLGIVAGLVDGLELVEYLNEHVGVDPRETLSIGANQTLPNQLGKGTQPPTLRWIFQCFMASTSSP